MNKSFSRVIISYFLMATMMLSGCGKKSECELPARHVHKYTKQVTDNIEIERYMDSERLNVEGYKWNNEYIEINKIDEELYKLFRKNGLFDGINNWDYLYNVMANCHDYLQFYYEYTTIETYTTTDSKGNITTHTRPVHHSGWHSNPYDSNNTGKTRLFHHRFYGYRVINKDGKFKLEKSNAVDDIRDIIYDYSYFSENCKTLVFEEYRFSKYQLGNLHPEDFNVFNGPDLENTSLEPGIRKIREK